MVHECKICGYVYDEVKGDPKGNIPVSPGPPFEQISPEWHCPICDAAKDYSFVEKAAPSFPQ